MVTQHIFCDSGLDLIRGFLYAQLNTVGVHYHTHSCVVIGLYSCDPEFQPVVTGSCFLYHAAHFLLDCLRLILPKGFLIGVSAFVFVV